jgi:UDP-N-acetylmuramoylalanine--D-glutamate ligase
MIHPIPHLPHALGTLTSDQEVYVLGAGESGRAMARWIKAQGVQVVIFDTREETSISEALKNQIQELDIPVHFGNSFHQMDFDKLGLIAMSPGISPFTPVIKELLDRAQQNQVKVWGELELFSQALHALKTEQTYTPKIIAITGTNGKTTTTALCGLICEKAGKTVAIAGNISPSLLDKLTECLLENHLPEVWVLELSSYQLFYSQSFNPDAATVLNISEDHLDWHGEIAHYIASKKKIFGPQTIAILNRDDAQVMSMIDEDDHRRVITFGMETPLTTDSFGIVGDMHGGLDWLAWVMPPEDNGQKKRRRTKVNPDDEALFIKRLIPAEALLIKGRHNATNTLAALALAQSIDLSMAALLHGLRDYRGEPHRVQSVAVIRDVEYIDDSKGTNVGATLAALKGLGTASMDKKIILIAGGDGKGQDFEPLREPVNTFVKHVFLLGKDAQLIEEVVRQANVGFTRVESIQESVEAAAKIARAGDIVLLSPACASLDMFKDYVHRAEVFVAAVEELTHQSQAIGVLE